MGHLCAVAVYERAVRRFTGRFLEQAAQNAGFRFHTGPDDQGAAGVKQAAGYAGDRVKSCLLYTSDAADEL